MTTDADAELLRAVTRGDRRALRQLYTTYHRRLIRFLMRVTRDTQLSEEILNDTMWVVWRNAASFREESRVSTWITGIAYRRALKSLATQRRHAPGHNRSLDDKNEFEADAAMAVSFAEQLETSDWIETAMAQLSPEHRMTLELAYFMGETCEAIAQISDCPVGTVKTRLHHARIHMQRHLARAGSRQRNDEDRSE